MPQHTHEAEALYLIRDLALALAVYPSMRAIAARVVRATTELIGRVTSEAVASALEAALRGAVELAPPVTHAGDAAVARPRFARPRWTPPPPSYPVTVADTDTTVVFRRETRS